MTWKIDQPVRVGAGVFAAIVEVQLDVRAVRKTVIGKGEKRPLMYMYLRDNTVSGMDIHGTPIARDEIERRFPTAVEQMHAFLARKP